MSRVKFNVNSEYGYLQNFKILQSTTLPESLARQEADHFHLGTFTKHQIERVVPVSNLIKCKMQDNLEFLQWTKRFWDQYFPGGEYDAIARRKASGAPIGGAPAAAPVRTSGAGVGGGGARRGTTPTNAASGPRGASTRTPGGGGGSAAVLTAENNQLKDTLAGLEKERDFYFSKLRDIELLIQQAIEVDPEIEKDEEGLIKHIQAILYSTEVSNLRL